MFLRGLFFNNNTVQHNLPKIVAVKLRAKPALTQSPQQASQFRVDCGFAGRRGRLRL